MLQLYDGGQTTMIFCVEDDQSIRDLMIYTLKASGFDAVGLEDGEKLFLALEKDIPQLIMLDIMLPGDDGITILKKLRENHITAEIPIIMATAKGTEYDKVIGLDLGADDYLTKPFGMMEMVSRVKAVLRRSVSKDNQEVLRIGNLELNLDNHTVIANGNRVELSFKEFELLRLFMKNLGYVFSRNQLLNKIWGTNFMGETRTVDVHIGTLRTKLGECGSYIKTVRGVGYRMEDRL